MGKIADEFSMNRKMRRAAQARGKRSLASQAAAIDPDFISGFLEHGWRLLNEGRDEEAMEIAKRLIRLEETDTSKAFFVQCLKQWSYFPGAEEMRDLLARALLESWARVDDLLGSVMGLLDRDPVIEPAMRRASDAWPRRLALPDLLRGGGLPAVSDDPLLLALLEAGKIIDLQLERVLTSIRAGLLGMTMQGNGYHDNATLRLSCALARQCFNALTYRKRIYECDTTFRKLSS